MLSAITALEEDYMRITSILSSTLHFAAGFDMFETGSYDEDGGHVIGERHFVEARDPNGRKWRRHVANYVSSSAFFDVDEDMPYPLDTGPTREQVAACAQELADRLNRANENVITDPPKLDSEVWDWEGHVYGSELWNQEDELSLMDDDELTAYWSRQ